MREYRRKKAKSDFWLLVLVKRHYSNYLRYYQGVRLYAKRNPLDLRKDRYATLKMYAVAYSLPVIAIYLFNARGVVNAFLHQQIARFLEMLFWGGVLGVGCFVMFYFPLKLAFLFTLGEEKNVTVDSVKLRKISKGIHVYAIAGKYEDIHKGRKVPVRAHVSFEQQRIATELPSVGGTVTFYVDKNDQETYVCATRSLLLSMCLSKSRLGEVTQNEMVAATKSNQAGIRIIILLVLAIPLILGSILAILYFMGGFN